MGSSFVAAAGMTLAISAALPPPPDMGALPTRMYGIVIVPHARHLAVRVACRTCHGDGPVSRIAALGPQRGHAICYRCHVERSAGPTECHGCHSGLPPKKVPAPAVVRTRTGGWRALRWCMTTAEVRGALTSMRAPEHGAMTFVEFSGERGVREFDVALDEPVSPEATATRARLAFRRDALSAIKLFLSSPNEGDAYRGLLVDLTAAHGPPTLADPPDEFWWIVEDTSTLLLPAIPEVAPVEIWLNDRAPATCQLATPHPDHEMFREDTGGRPRPAAHRAPAVQVSPTASQ